LLKGKKSGKTWIFQNTPRSDDQLDQLPSNPMFATISATDLPSISCDQLDQLKSPTDPTDLQLIHEVITSKPLQEREFRSIVVSDHLIDHLSEKIENQNVSDCVKFIRSANYKRLPNLILSLGAVLQIFLTPDRVLGVLLR
jgi:hypothetical protein